MGSDGAEINKYYESLGVKPGASLAELKAAHRDLAKVWHPDRFGHDERLQKRAQEKLKEINQAYEILTSRKVPRPKPNSSQSERRTHDSYYRPPQQRGAASYTPSTPGRSRIPIQWIIVPLLLFGAIFYAASRYLFRPDVISDSTASQVSQEQRAVPTSSSTATIDSASKQKVRNEVAPKIEVTSQASATETTPLALQPIQTTTVLIDPSTGLLAKADCPVKTRVTYPVGDEPHGYCTAVHSAKSSATTEDAQQKDSTVKSIAKKIVSPKRLLSSGNKESEGERQ